MFADRNNWNFTPNALSELLTRQREAGKEILDLTVSNPTQCGFAYDEQRILAALNNSHVLQYEPNPKGLVSARDAVREYYAAKRIEIPVEDIFLTASTSEAYSFVCRTLCNPGDEILVPQPSYPLFSFLADILDVTLRYYPLTYLRAGPGNGPGEDWRIDFASLQQAITERTRGIVVVNPNNPTGNFLQPDEAERLNEICSAKGIAILADEVFLDFPSSNSVTPFQQRSLAANRDALTFVLSGVSKICGLPQMKVAWLVVQGPAKLKEQALARLEVIADTYLSVSTPVQLALPRFLEERDAFQKQVNTRIQKNLRELDRLLSSKRSLERLAVEGGWYAVLRAATSRTDEELAMQALSSENVYVHPGHFFDFLEEGHLVVSLITPETIFAEGMRRLSSLFD